MAERAIKWNPTADYIARGILVVVLLDSTGTTTDRESSFDLTKFFPAWDKMSEAERYTSGLGVKQSADHKSAGAGSRMDRYKAIVDGFQDLLDGSIPGVNGRLTYGIRALAEYHGKTEGEMRAKWTKYSDKEKAEQEKHPGVVAIIGRMATERAVKKADRLTKEAEGAEPLKF
jgi:hypothetical protein